MAKGLSTGRISNIAKTVTDFNIGGDAKDAIKEQVERELAHRVEEMVASCIEKEPDTKTLFDPDRPHLSTNRIRGLASQHTDLNVSSSAILALKEYAERRIRELTKSAEIAAILENIRTIKARHLPTAPSTEGKPAGDGSDQEGASTPAPLPDASDHFTDASLKRLAKTFTPIPLDDDAIMEIRERIYDEMETELIILGEVHRKKDLRAIETQYRSIQKLVEGVRMRQIVREAETVAKRRGKGIISLEEVLAAYDSLQQVRF